LDKSEHPGSEEKRKYCFLINSKGSHDFYHYEPMFIIINFAL